MSEDGGEGIRIDRLLVYLRFARTRSAACAMIDGGALRRNRKHVRRASENVFIGDVLTLAVGNDIRVVEVTSLPTRRASPALAKTHYNELARSEATASGAGTDNLTGHAKSP